MYGFNKWSIFVTMNKTFNIYILLLLVQFNLSAQQLPTLEPQGQGAWCTTEGVAHLTLDDAIFTAQNQSIAAMTAKYIQKISLVKIIN